MAIIAGATSECSPLETFPTKTWLRRLSMHLDVEAKGRFL